MSAPEQHTSRAIRSLKTKEPGSLDQHHAVLDVQRRLSRRRIHSATRRACMAARRALSPYSTRIEALWLFPKFPELSWTVLLAGSAIVERYPFASTVSFVCWPKGATMAVGLRLESC